MRARSHAENPGRLAERGFTLLELITVVAMIAIFTAIAFPPLVSWRQNLRFRQTASQMASMLHEARALAIGNSFQYMVVFTPNGSSYQILKGSLAYNTPATGWTQVVRTSSAPANVSIGSNPGGTSQTNVYVQFNPNGTANLRAPDGTACDPNVFVNDAGMPRYSVSITQTGKVTVKRLS